MILKFRVYCYEEDEFIIADNYRDLAELFSALDTDDGFFSEVMQSTGMFDKNGKEIYEGDVVRLDYKIDDNFNIYEVKKLRAGTWMVENQFMSKELYLDTYCIEVVGHKYMEDYKEFLND